MPNLDEVLAGLTPEATPQGDWDAPEAGAFPPDVRPGTYRLIFELPEDADNHTDSFDVAGTKYFVVNFNPTVVSNGDGTQLPARTDGSARRLMFQRASSYKSAAFKGNSDLQELLRSLGLIVIPYEPRNIYTTLQGVSGRGEFTAEVGWRAYFEAGDVTVSTHVRKRKNKSGVKTADVPWPRNADGSFAEFAVNPTTGERSYGRAEIVRYRLPEGTRTTPTR